MQIAQVVPKAKTLNTDVFDYSIPPELLPQIRPGLLVEIPFHGRKIEGIIINLKRSSHIPRLLPIISVIDPEPVVDKTHIRLAEWMSNYYLIPLGKTLFENIVPPAKRTIKNLTKEEKPLTIAKVVKKNKYQKSRKYLIVADFNHRLKFYLQAIEKTLAQKKQVLILIPDLGMLHFFTKSLPQANLGFIHSQMTKTQRWLEWEKIRQGKTKIIIGSQSAIFAPTNNLGLIIIDQEENETYKNDRSPRFHVVNVAEELSKLTAVTLVIGSLTPRVETYFKALKNIYTLKKIEEKPRSITIVDMNNQHQAVSLPLQQKVEENLKLKKKIILVLNRKGEGIKYACPDCHWTATCEKCGMPLTPQEDRLFCFRCEKSVLPPQKCPKCQSVHLKPFGLGTRRLEKILKNLWNKASIVRIEDEKQFEFKKNQWDIAIVTSYALKFNLPPIGLSGIIDADQGFNFPDFRSAEKTFQNLYKFLKIGGEGIIQTHSPDNPTISALAKLSYENFFTNELSVRQTFDFPPFVQLIRLLYKNVTKENTQKETERVSKLLENIVSILGPTPAFIERKRGYYCWQILIKIQRQKQLEEIKNILTLLPQGWVVDVDPINLL
ncbi:MAG: primosomal protein N' [Patescibacteria group bacterium]